MPELGAVVDSPPVSRPPESVGGSPQPPEIVGGMLHCAELEGGKLMKGQGTPPEIVGGMLVKFHSASHHEGESHQNRMLNSEK